MVDFAGFESGDTVVVRDRLFTIRLSVEERQRIDDLAQHYGIDAASLVRMLVTREYRAKAGELPTPKKAKKT